MDGRKQRDLPNGHRWDRKRFDEVEFPLQRVPWIYFNGSNIDIAWHKRHIVNFMAQWTICK